MTDAIITQKDLYDSIQSTQLTVDALSTLAAMSPEEDELTALLGVVSDRMKSQFDELKTKSFSILKHLPEEVRAKEGEG